MWLETKEGNSMDIIKKIKESKENIFDKAVKRITDSKYDLSEEEKKTCQKIIHSASAAATAAGAGLAQIPLADGTVITPIQVAMIVSLGKVFGRSITEGAARGILSGVIANYLGRSISQVAIGWIPIVGNTVNAATAAIITEAVGWLSVDSFYEMNMQEAENQKAIIDEDEEKNKEIKQRVEVWIALAEQFIQGEKNELDNQTERTECIDEYNELQDVLEERKTLEEFRDMSKKCEEVYERLLGL